MDKNLNKSIIKKKGSKLYIGNSGCYLKDNGCDYFFYGDDGEFQGTYVGGLKTLEGMSENEALDYIYAGL